MRAKEIHKQKLLEYLGNPDNEFLRRKEMYEVVLKIRRQTFHKHFTTREIRDIEYEALELRKQNSAKNLSEVYSALAEEAKAGDVKAIKEYLDRIEGKVIDKKNIDLNATLNPAGILQEIKDL